ncbi:SigE family RNA polymerase sigma factor [Actinomycetospora endophytica]|uniref:SigE family RNA polymerase sigma factor n=1 Tax=Actinomycetospora endophytica TaxID=2291215 RepID=A0ABS8P3W8_9PSEU|nr:SigE family RNA polymerase sigma factor [Actinomycetospora endophytica]MCD2192933.1 SigE family RNA polymerase sigma factor [Actinomycetospora endophytica]
MVEPVESAIERTLGSLRALDAVTGAEASVVHPAAPPAPRQDSRGPAPARPAPGRPGPGHPAPARPGAPAPPPAPGPWAAPESEAVPEGPRTLEDLYREHRMRFVRLAILLVDDPATAEDVVQEAFTGLHRHWSRLRDENAALGYLRTAVVNGSRSVLRRRRTAREYTPPHTADARSAESLAMLSAEHQAVVSALGQLPRRQREVLVLRYYGGLSEAEIADATGISRGTVKSTASRGLDAISKIVGAGP